MADPHGRFALADSFDVSLVTPEQAVLTEQATYAELPAHDGQLGVMANRAPMLIKLGVGRLKLELAAGQTRWFVLDGGFAQMRNNRLTLLSEKAFDGQELTAEQAREQMREAEALPRSTVEQVDQRDHDLQLARSLQAVAGR